MSVGETAKYAGARSKTYQIPETGEGLNSSITQLPKANSTRLDEFETWLDERREKAHPYPLQHTWSHRSARKRFARAKDVDRYFWGAGKEFTTVLLTRTADESPAGLLEQSESLHPRAYKAKRRRLLKSLSDDYAGVSCMAPKYDLPMPNSTVLSHVHEAYWIEGHHSAEAFEPLIEKHDEKVPGATGGHISVEHHSPETYPCLTPQSEADEIRGSTTALAYELAENLPLMNVATDAADLHDMRALEWCATLSAGSDGDHSTRGVRRWLPFGEFGEYADTVKEGLWFKAKRDYRRTMRDDDLNHPWLTPQPVDESESTSHSISQRAESAFIEAVAQFASKSDV
ncbi:hypothetical protein [Halolamina salifodinae]|uniref:Uncharacterized protein n=1 Tax=Halolamina salifodinae TaxID=1202767 RepID=A0A8T4GX10_9EURY|nr:hypothetical protein [Halolamina salifodinae]MBP1985855.1 hypothetical protein [Halolamina salifodinae]